MPASPSFHSDTRKWKRRKRQPRKQLNNRHHEDDVVEDEDEEQDNTETDNHNNNSNMDHRENGDDFQHGTAPDPASNESEVLIDGGTRICEFPTVVRRVVSRPHVSVMDIVAIERANLAGDNSSGRSSVLALENISYGQLQALSAVPADSAALDPERSDTSCVITPPQIMEGKGVVKRFGSRVHVVPMHSGSNSITIVNFMFNVSRTFSTFQL